MLKTRPKQILGLLQLVIALPILSLFKQKMHFQFFSDAFFRIIIIICKGTLLHFKCYATMNNLGDSFRALLSPPNFQDLVPKVIKVALNTWGKSQVYILPHCLMPQSKQFHKMLVNFGLSRFINQLPACMACVQIQSICKFGLKVPRTISRNFKIIVGSK